MQVIDNTYHLFWTLKCYSQQLFDTNIQFACFATQNLLAKSQQFHHFLVAGQLYAMYDSYLQMWKCNTHNTKIILFANRQYLTQRFTWSWPQSDSYRILSFFIWTGNDLALIHSDFGCDLNPQFFIESIEFFGSSIFRHKIGIRTDFNRLIHRVDVVKVCDK